MLTIISELAKSISQQRLFGMVHAYQKYGELPDDPKLAKKIKDIADGGVPHKTKPGATKGIDPEDAEDFARTKHKNLPYKVSKENKMTKNNFKNIIKEILYEIMSDEMDEEKMQFVSTNVVNLPTEILDEVYQLVKAYTVRENLEEAQVKFDKNKVKKIVNSDTFLKHEFSKIRGNEEAKLKKIFDKFIKGFDEFEKRYKKN